MGARQNEANGARPAHRGPAGAAGPPKLMAQTRKSARTLGKSDPMRWRWLGRCCARTGPAGRIASSTRANRWRRATRFRDRPNPQCRRIIPRLPPHVIAHPRLEKFRVGDKVTVPKSPVAQVHSNAPQVRFLGTQRNACTLWARAARQESEGGDSGFVTRILAIHEWLAPAGPRGGWVPGVSGDGLHRGRVLGGLARRGPSPSHERLLIGA
jgi:hypothetical protein